MPELKIPFNKPFLTGNELKYIQQAVLSGKISGDGGFTKKCHNFFESRYGFKKALLTTSCTDALEMAAILINTQPGDEIIIPSYTFVSTASAFVLRGAKVVFTDSSIHHPNMDADTLEPLITAKTKAIVVVHYAGVACDMDRIRELADKHSLFVIEDAALALDSYYKGKPCGGLSDLAAFSFHETKNVISGEGGMLIINNEKLTERAEVIREKGTNRSKFFRGEIDKYNWVDIGSSFLPSDMIAAFLSAQLESMDTIQATRKKIWWVYNEGLKELEAKGFISLPVIPDYARHNASMFYIKTKSLAERTALISSLADKGIKAVFHYLSLHQSPYYVNLYGESHLPNADDFSDTLVRLPFFYGLTYQEQQEVIAAIQEFYK